MNSKQNRVWTAVAAGVLAAMGMVGAQAAARSVPSSAGGVVTLLDDAPDRLIFKDGRIVEGELLEETATQVRFMVVVAGIKGEQTYNKADILAIERGEKDDGPKATDTKAVGKAEKATNPADEPQDGSNAVYVLELTGQFGRDIAPTPIRKAVKDAAQHRPDYVIVVVDNAWENRWGQELPDEAAAFDQLFQTEDIEPIFTKELPEMLGYTPKVVVWVKNAMGGAAFLPLNFDTIYFASDGKMGGIGNLTELFGSTGDERVREKQFSLRMGHARGMAVRGGYDTRIVEAMARLDYVLSYRIEGGKAVLVEGMPNTDLGEVLLTDNGAGENADDIKELARGLGDDALTLDAEVAAILGLSRGTVDDLDDLLYELDIDRDHRIIDGRGVRIMEGWDRELESAERSLRDLWKRLADTQVQREYRERQAARATQMRIIKDIIRLLEKYNEVYKVGLLELPPGLPPVPQLEVIHEQIRQEQMKDKP